MFQEFNDLDRAQAEEKLVRGKGTIDLEVFHRIYLSNAFKYGMKRLDEKNPAAMSKTISWLLPLLQSGELKMRRSFGHLETDPVLIKEIRQFSAQQTGIVDNSLAPIPAIDRVWYTTPASAKKDLEELERDWNELPKDDHSFELWTNFTLGTSTWSPHFKDAESNRKEAGE